MPRTLMIDRRFSGFPGVALGGYTAGILAREIGSAAEIRFRRVVPVETALEIDRDRDGAATLSADRVVLAEGRAAPLDVGPIPRVDREAASRAARDHLGREVHLFPSCFCCGPANAEGEGLRVFVGRVPDRSALAGMWTAPSAFAAADGGIPTEIAVAAIDCPGIWALVVAAPPDSPDHVVTGTLAAHVVRPLRAGERYLVIAWPLGRDGRRLHAGTAVIDEEGAPVVVARQTCVVTDTGVPLSPARWSIG